MKEKAKMLTGEHVLGVVCSTPPASPEMVILLSFSLLGTSGTRGKTLVVTSCISQPFTDPLASILPISCLPISIPF